MASANTKPVSKRRMMCLPNAYRSDWPGGCRKGWAGVYRWATDGQRSGRRSLLLLCRVLGTLLGGLLQPAEIARAVDQRKMREGLRKIADQTAQARIVFFTEQ